MKTTDIHAYKAEGFIGRLQKLIKDTVIPYQYSVLCDGIQTAEKSHAVSNFVNAAKTLAGEDTGDGFYGMVFQDSDAAKWLEAAAYSLGCYPDEKLEKTADELIELIASAQDSDGYLNTRFTIKDKDKRWTNLLEGHELYCSGHFIEAATAYYEATGKRRLLDVMLKNVEHIYDVFITKGHEGYPGHPEIELALIKMYELTKNEKCLLLAKHFIDIRGKDPHYYEKERAKREWTVWGGDGKNHWYQQSHCEVRQQKDAVGHSVRAVYLYTAMAALCAHTDDKELLDACERLWDSITKKRMYITGAIGSTVHGEAFTVDYDLPSDTVYGETCASIGLMFFASRMLENTLDGKYADVMERAFYNGVLAGMAADGKSFFYVNPLEVIPGISGEAVTHRHSLTKRPEWYACACCPPNVARLVASIGKYAYCDRDGTAVCHLFCGGEVKFRNGVHFICETAYPHELQVVYKIIKGGKIALRIPAWSESFTLIKNGEEIEAVPEKGYIFLDVQDGEKLVLHLDKKVKVIYPSAKIPALSGMCAFMRGPLVYCFEGADNKGDVLSFRVKEGGLISTVMSRQPFDGHRITVQGFKQLDSDDSLYSSQKPVMKSWGLIGIPYYLWGNRGENQMRVWLPIADGKSN